jgi:uncharacterized protein DUF4166
VSALTVSSPFSEVFAGPAETPLAFRLQFLDGRADGRPFMLRGLLRVWQRPRFLRPLFMLLGRAGILVSDTGDRVPTTLEVVRGHGADGRPFHEWRRTLRFRRDRQFNSRLIFDESIGRVVDLLGPARCIAVAWDAQFRPPDTFSLHTDACGVQMRGHRWWLPRRLSGWLFGVVDFVQRVQGPAGDTVTIELVIRHPLFGAVFGYEGRLVIVEPVPEPHA